MWHSCLSHRSPSGDRCTGKPAAMGERESALVGAFSSAWRQVHEGQPWQGPFLVLGGRAEASTWGDRGCNGGSALCTSLNSGALLPWQSGFPPQAFPVVDFLPPVPSSCLLTANSSPPAGFCSPIPTFQLPAPVCTGGHMSQSGAHRTVARTISVVLTLSCLPQTSCFTLL